MIEIDGNYLEGGGQILRTALAFSALTLKPFSISNIRKGRPRPGLQPQHLACVKSLEEFCGASSEGAEIGSMSLKFFPGKVRSRTLSFDIGTAGSLTLLLQALLLPAIFAPWKVRLKLSGGTDVTNSPPVDYFSSVFLPHISSFANINFSLLRRGYFPRGGGNVEVEFRPKFSLSDFDTFADLGNAVRQAGVSIGISSRGSLLKISGVSHASLDLKHASVAERQASAAKSSLSNQLAMLGLSCPVSILSEYSDSSSTGSGMLLSAHFSEQGKDEASQLNPVILGGDCLGERGKRSEIVGQEAAAALVREISSGGCADKFLADQMVPFLAISRGNLLASEITNHCRTNIFVVERFIGKRFKIDESLKLISFE